MIGKKERHFAPLIHLSLEDLVPQDHFYRHLERTLDLSFVREFVQDRYAGGGRPSIDPVVFFKLQLVMFCEGIRSERQLMRHAADRLSVRWYVGYDLGEPLPDHSSLTRIRERYGVEVFRRFFEAIVEQCQQAGLVWGRELYIDSTKVQANASCDSVKPRFAVEAHLSMLFVDQAEEATKEEEQDASQKECNHCPLKAQCTTSKQGRTLCRSVEEKYLDRVRGYHETEDYKKAYRKRSVWVEPLFAEGKDWHGMRRFRLRRLWRVNCEALLTYPHFLELPVAIA